MNLNDLVCFYLRCRFACDSLPFSNLRLLRIGAILCLPAKAALLRSPRYRIIGRRRLGCTCARSAEQHPQGVYRIRKAAKLPTAAQQRVVEAEANRLAKLTRLRRTQAVAFRRHKGCSSLGLPIKRLSFGRSHRPFSFLGKKMGGWSCRPQAAFLSARCAEFSPLGGPPSSLR